MIRVLDHDPVWRTKYELEAERVTFAAADAFVRIHHIGSTAVPSTKAKPIIDILLEVIAVAALDERAPAMRALGYEVMGEFGIPGRRYFRLDDANGTRTHQVHAFNAGSINVVRHLAFRDYLRAHPGAAYQYGELKARLALAYPNDMAAYMAGKDAFVKEHEARAMEWLSTGTVGVFSTAPYEPT